MQVWNIQFWYFIQRFCTRVIFWQAMLNSAECTVCVICTFAQFCLSLASFPLVPSTLLFPVGKVLCFSPNLHVQSAYFQTCLWNPLPCYNVQRVPNFLMLNWRVFIKGTAFKAWWSFYYQFSLKYLFPPQPSLKFPALQAWNLNLQGEKQEVIC